MGSGASGQGASAGPGVGRGGAGVTVPKGAGATSEFEATPNRNLNGNIYREGVLILGKNAASTAMVRLVDGKKRTPEIGPKTS